MKHRVATITKIKLFLVLGLFCLGGVSVTRQALAGNEIDFYRLREKPPVPTERFSPSNARTEDGNLIPVDQFISAVRCAKCHAETHAQWSESLHRNAGREPFYKASVDILEHQRGIEFTQHCESCHSPIAMLSGALRTGSHEPRTLDDEGVTCTVCHSITAARLDGTGSYTIRRPALLVRNDGTPVYGDLSDEQILAAIPDHKRAMMRDLLKTPEFCATCHKAAAPPSLNNYKYLRGFNTYDEWQMSGASTDTITPYYRRDKRADCRTCHMPLTGEGKFDLAADADGKIASHRFIGANTAAPMYYGQTSQVEKTEDFLGNQVLSVDIFALRDSSGEPLAAPLAQDKPQSVRLAPGQEVTAEVVVFNRKVAHSFPPELRDMYEPWVEFEVVDFQGTTVYHSGFIRPDHTLDERAHVYKSLLLDSFSRVVTRHQVWQSAIKAYDNFIPPGRSDIVHYTFRVPANSEGLTLRARVNYRRFIADYSDYVLRKYNRLDLNIPVVNMAEESVKVVFENQTNENETPKIALDKTRETIAGRWNDYGIGLLEQNQNGDAAKAFREAATLSPKNPDYLISAAIAEYRMERHALNEQSQLNKAKVLIDRALRIAPDAPRGQFYKAIVLRALKQDEEAAQIFADLANKHPLDREIWRQYGQTVYALGRIEEAKKAFETIVSIDPTDANAWQFLSPIYTSEGESPAAEKAEQLYLLWRDDPLAETVATKFFQSNPNWTEVRIPFHIYSDNSPLRPTLTGDQASSDK
jgi:tetratricopeptide (TPR) repeat protein